jgi:hypothetical protein
MGLERSQRAKTPGELMKARVAEDHERAVKAGAWVAECLPDLAGCSFAISLALRVSRERPGIKAGELAGVVRVQREVWMRRCGAWDMEQDNKESEAA